MSTRGAVGIRLGGVDKIGYNHFDSYPSGLGHEVLLFLKCKDLDGLKSLYEKIEIVDDEDDGAWDWRKHCFCDKFEDYSSFMADSLMNEWSYLINLDEGVLEIYRGFNKDANALGRYASLECKGGYGDGYKGVVLERTIPLDDLFQGRIEIDDKDEFIKIEA